MTALRKPNGWCPRHRGRRHCPQVGWAHHGTTIKRVEVATSPFQCALSTQGRDGMRHSCAPNSDRLDERATILSVDGIGAYDLIRGMPCCQVSVTWRTVQSCPSSVPFVAVLPRVLFLNGRTESETSSQNHRTQKRQTVALPRMAVIPEHLIHGGWGHLPRMQPCPEETRRKRVMPAFGQNRIWPNKIRIWPICFRDRILAKPHLARISVSKC